MKLITLTRGLVAKVDDEDFDFLNQWRWYATPNKDGTFRAQRTEKSDGRKKTITMSRLILRMPEGSGLVDHRDLDTLNNQKDNLRRSNKSLNGANRLANDNNTSGYKGVTWHKLAKKWLSQITVRGTRLYLGLFTDPAAASDAYYQAAKEHFGEYARRTR